MEALLGAKLQHMHKQQQPRSARVNTLKMSVPQALAWLRAPPAAHSAFASKVFNHRCNASVPANEGCLPLLASTTGLLQRPLALKECTASVIYEVAPPKPHIAIMGFRSCLINLSR